MLGGSSRVVVALCAGLILLLAPATAAARPGDLDSSYSGDGRVRVNLGSNETNAQAGLDSKGRLVIAVDSGEDHCVKASCWYEYEKVLIRILGDGERDSGFGQDGETRLGTSLFDEGFGIRSDDVSITAIRNGWHATDSQGQQVWTVDAGGCCISGSAILPDDGFLGYGYKFEDGTISMWLQRRTALGELDPTFGSSGELERSEGLQLEPSQALVLADGRFYVSATHRQAIGAPERLLIFRFQPDGDLDPSFGDAGSKEVDPGGIGLQSDGSLIYDDRDQLRRILPDGSFDPSFGSGGSADVPGGSRASVLPDDRIFVRVGEEEHRLLTSEGAPDSTYGRDGRARTLGLPSGPAPALQQPDGALLIAGPTGSRGPNDVSIVRLTMEEGPPDADADGVLNTSDKCHLVHGPAPSGCPTFGRTASMRYGKRKKTFFVRVGHGVFGEECAYRGVVKLRRRANGKRKIVRRDTFSKSNRFELRFPRRRGRYRAVIEENTLPRVGHCAKTKTDPVRIKPRKRRRAQR